MWLASSMTAATPKSALLGMMRGALFGFFADATYDLTNLATLKNWPIGLSAPEMAWGSIASAAAAVAGHFAYQWTQ